MEVTVKQGDIYVNEDGQYFKAVLVASNLTTGNKVVVFTTLTKRPKTVYDSIEAIPLYYKLVARGVDNGSNTN